MIVWLTGKIVNRLVYLKAVKDEDREIYEYGLDVMLNSVVITGLVVLLSLLYRDILYAAFYYACYWPMRRNGGGFHASTHLRCALMQLVSFSLVTFVANWAAPYVAWPMVLALFTLILAAAIWKAPAQHPDNPMKPERVPILRRNCIITVILAFVGSMALLILNYPVYAAIVTLTALVATLSMLISNKPSEEGDAPT